MVISSPLEVINKRLFKNLFLSNKASDQNIASNTYYRQDGVTVEKIVESDILTGKILKIKTFDYFNDKKIKSVEDFVDGRKVRMTTYSFMKSVSDFDKETGKKIKTTHYDINNESKIVSIYDYDIVTEKIIRMTVYRSDGKSIAFIKEISPETGLITRCINYKKSSSAISSVSHFEMLGDTTVKTTYYYSNPVSLSSIEAFNKKITADKLNKKVLGKGANKKVEKLIDNLYRNKMSFASLGR